MGQESYLLGKQLIYKQWIQYQENWDHDHCEFCMAKFSNYKDALHSGYCTMDERQWICEDCYNDFKEFFQWRTVNK
jgi:hypothetical protein